MTRAGVLPCGHEPHSQRVDRYCIECRAPEPGSAASPVVYQTPCTLWDHVDWVEFTDGLDHLDELRRHVQETAAARDIWAANYYARQVLHALMPRDQRQREPWPPEQDAEPGSAVAPPAKKCEQCGHADSTFHCDKCGEHHLFLYGDHCPTLDEAGAVATPSKGDRFLARVKQAGPLDVTVLASSAGAVAPPQCPECRSWLNTALTADGTWNCANCKHRWGAVASEAPRVDLEAIRARQGVRDTWGPCYGGKDCQACVAKSDIAALLEEVTRLSTELAMTKLVHQQTDGRAYAAGLQRAAELCRAADVSGEGMEMARDAIRAELKGEG